ncbi:MAG: hypothetical protein ACI85E_000890, partial [Marinomonas primoryensis]
AALGPSFRLLLYLRLYCILLYQMPEKTKAP